ncbi:putative transcription factor SEF1 [Yarrowia sp. B02]|nr:putative transcription factor SEF1 [Yarrowia sp. B02]
MKRPATDSPEDCMLEPRAEDSKPPLKTRPVTSCSMCRQQKVKCDAGKMYPNACTRCAKLNKHCVVDPMYKPPKGSQLKSVMDEVQLLRNEIEIHTSKPVTSTTSTSSSSTYTLNGVTLNAERVVRLHKRFVERYLPYLPILETHSPEELYEQSKLLFWTVMVTACLSDPNPQQYNQLWPHVKNLIIETCWLHTPRSTHVVQALLVLATWPLPNMKILDDWSYRLIGLAKNISLQLGLHRGEFVSEFSRSQVRMTDAVKWRTRSWMAIFFLEQVWCSSLGLPPTTQADSLINNAATKLPSFSFAILIRLSAFCSRLINLVGNSQTSADGLIPYDDRINVLAVINNELDVLAQQLDLSEPSAEMYYLNIRLMIAVFSFIGGTDTRFIMNAYNAATRAVAILCGLPYQITQYPIWMRQCASFAATVLFRLHLSPHLLPKYHETARGSVVALHAKFKQMVTHWPVDNDISRIAKVVEKLNRTIVTNPELFKTPGIVSRMRSHLSASLFYELIWIIHEAQRRNGGGNSQGVSTSNTGRNTPTPQQPAPPVSSNSTSASVPNAPPNGSAPINGILKDADDSMAPLQLERPPVVKDEQFNDFGFPSDLGVIDIMQDWMDGKGDDFLGWMDVNLSPEF